MSLKNFVRLKEIGCHEPAYNLLFERTEYTEIGWEREELEEKLKSTENYIYP